MSHPSQQTSERPGHVAPILTRQTAEHPIGQQWDTAPCPKSHRPRRRVRCPFPFRHRPQPRGHRNIPSPRRRFSCEQPPDTLSDSHGTPLDRPQGPSPVVRAPPRKHRTFAAARPQVTLRPRTAGREPAANETPIGTTAPGEPVTRQHQYRPHGSPARSRIRPLFRSQHANTSPATDRNIARRTIATGSQPRLPCFYAPPMRTESDTDRTAQNCAHNRRPHPQHIPLQRSSDELR